MPHVWDADIETVTAERAKALIEIQFPELAPISIESFGAGWDNLAYLINESIVFRFPRRQIALRLLENEIRCLCLIAPNVPVRVSSPEYVGVAVPGSTAPFAGYSLIAGKTACRAKLTDEDRAALAAPLGRFLAALHNIETNLSIQADELGRSDIVGRRPRLEANLRIAATIVPDLDLARLLALVDRLAETPLVQPHQLRLVHGDLYARHIVVDDSLRLAGIIDWGDVHFGDPALDLSIAFSFLRPSARAEFRAAYGPIEEATWDRARFRAIHYGAIFTHFGTESSDDAICAAGEYALCNAIE